MRKQSWSFDTKDNIFKMRSQRCTYEVSKEELSSLGGYAIMPDYDI